MSLHLSLKLTTNCVSLLRIKWKRYIFIKKCVSFVHWSSFIIFDYVLGWVYEKYTTHGDWSLRSNLEAKSQYRSRGEVLFLKEYREVLHKLHWSSDLSQPQKIVYQDLVEVAISDPFVKQFGWSLGEVWFQWNWVSGLS